jgi:predicted transcriptional regulator of viral defense system
MYPERPAPHARAFLDRMAATGRYAFVSAEAQEALGVSPAAAKLALSRLAKQGLVASPARGFYVIVPPEYRRLGCLPADQFIPALMQSQKLPYYAGLLSAAQYYGAAHHAPQVFQVLIPRRRASIACGAVRVAFFARRSLKDVATRAFNTPRGPIAVSSPEATAVDLVGYHQHVGGFDNVATVLAELANELDPAKLVEAVRSAPLPWAQRLGYLLDLVGAGPKAEALRDYVKAHANEYAPLLSSVEVDPARRDANWKLFVNERVEAEV